ncbi:MAG: hypothetical protein AAB478_03735 [Patescibacteria group bacterium]
MRFVANDLEIKRAAQVEWPKGGIPVPETNVQGKLPVVMIAGCSKEELARIRRVIERDSDAIREGFHPDANRNIVWILIPAGTTTMSLDLLKSALRVIVPQGNVTYAFCLENEDAYARTYEWICADNFVADLRRREIFVLVGTLDTLIQELIRHVPALLAN